MKGTKTDLLGKVFGKLTVTGEVAERSKEGQVIWACRCDCGQEIRAKAGNLRSGNTASCGCARKETLASVTVTHGHTRSKARPPTYLAWWSMIARCTYQSSSSYRFYGGRGVTVCDRWRGRQGYANFFADMGERPEGLTLDRIDPHGNYEPSNCRWASWAVQHQNKRNRAA